jgi:hypothetical protein
VISVGLFAGLPARSDADFLVNQPSQYPNPFNGMTSQNAASGASFQSFDNFTLTGSNPVTISSITWQGIYWNPVNPSANPLDFSPPSNTPPNLTENYFAIGFFADSNNLPVLNPQPEAIPLTNLTFANVGTAVFGPDNGGGYDTVNVYNFSADLAAAQNPFQLNPGTYWLSIVWFAPNNSYPPVFVWTSGTGGDGKSAQLAYGQPNAEYVPADRAFTLSSEASSGPLDAIEHQNTPIGQLADLPEPGSFAIVAALFAIGGASHFRRPKKSDRASFMRD